MKFLIVAVFCAHFAVAFTQEFNSTIPSQLTGKMETTDDSRKIQAPRIDIVRIKSEDDRGLCKATLLNEKSVAMTEWCSNRTDIKFALVLCADGSEKEMTLKLAMDKSLQEIKGIGITQVEFSEPVGEECWPGGRTVFPLISNGAAIGDRVMLSMVNDVGLFREFFARIQGINDDFIIIEPLPGHTPPCRVGDGAALYHNDNLIGIFSFHVFQRYGSLRQFVRVHKQVRGSNN